MLLIVFFIGALWGSFLALLTYRMPKGISIIKPRSFCENCNAKIPIWINVPIFSYLILRGKTKCCDTKINFRNFIIEVLTAILFLYSYLFIYDDIYSLIRTVIIITAIVPSIFIDIEYRIIPDRLSIGLVISGFILSLFDPYMAWHTSLAGIVIAGGVLFLVSIAYYKMTGREGLGGGDIKLIAGIGAVMGWYPAMIIMFLSSLTGSLYGIVIMLFFKKNRLTEIPFGPFIGGVALLYYLIIEGGLIF